MATWTLEQQNWVVAAEIGWSKKPKIFTIWLFKEKVDQLPT